MKNNETLGKRIKSLEAIFDIKNLKFQYWNSCDSKKPKDILNCFSIKGVHIDFEDFGIFSSAHDMVEKYKLNSCHEHLLEQHAGKNPIINLLSNNQATGFWSMSYSLIDTRKNFCLNINGSYEDLYERDEVGNWLIKKTFFKKTSSFYKSFASGYCSESKVERTLGFKKTI